MRTGVHGHSPRLPQSDSNFAHLAGGILRDFPHGVMGVNLLIKSPLIISWHHRQPRHTLFLLRVVFAFCSRRAQTYPRRLYKQLTPPCRRYTATRGNASDFFSPRTEPSPRDSASTTNTATSGVNENSDTLLFDIYDTSLVQFACPCCVFDARRSRLQNLCNKQLLN